MIRLPIVIVAIVIVVGRLYKLANFAQHTDASHIARHKNENWIEDEYNVMKFDMIQRFRRVWLNDAH